MNDSEIVKMFINRDQNAIVHAEEQYRKYCSSIAFGILYNREDSDEAVNDTYLGAWNSIPPNKPENLKTYLGRLTRNISIKILRSKNSEKRGNGKSMLILDEIAECTYADNNTEKEIELKELSDAVNSFVRKLPEEEQKIFICRYWYFESVKGIAERFSMSESKIKSMLFRTRKKLVKHLRKEAFL